MSGPRWGLAIVRGASMEPTLHAGDIVLARYAARARPGALAVVRLPPRSDGVARPVAVKRLATPPEGSPAGSWWLSSDNPAQGTDSRSFGPVPGDAVLAVATRLPRFVQRRFSRTAAPSPPSTSSAPE